MLKAPMMHTCPACSFACSAEPIAGVICCERCGKNFEANLANTIQTENKTQTWIAQPNEDINGYILERKIGQGGMAEVWLAKDGNKKVVIKILLPKLNQNEQIRKRFEREIDSLSRFEHRHIIPISDHGESHDRLYYVTPTYARCSLRQELDRRAQAPCDVSFLQQLSQQTLDALDHAHQQHVVHRDIKPENILLLDNGDFAVSDFGIAQMHSTHDGQTLTMLTNTNAVLGTYAYMAPEQNRGSRQVDARADLYALGVVLYESLSGHLPEGRFEDPAVFLQHYAKADREAWNTFILTLLERDPNKRYQSARHALAALPGSEIAPHAIKPDKMDSAYPHGNTLYRYSPHGWIGGVCSGLGAWTGIDAGWIRLGMCFGMFFSAGILFIAYIAAVILLPECPDDYYRPRPLNRNLPRRGDGWFLGVCDMLGQRSGNSGIWRLIFVIGAPFTAFTILIPYLAIGVVFPGPEQKRHHSKRHIRAKHQEQVSQHDEQAAVGWGHSFMSTIVPCGLMGYLSYDMLIEQELYGLGISFLAITFFLAARLHTRIQMTPVNFTGFASGLALAGVMCFMTHAVVQTPQTAKTLGVYAPNAHIRGPIQSTRQVIISNNNAVAASASTAQTQQIRHKHYYENLQYAAPMVLTAAIVWSLLCGYYGPLAIILGLLPATGAFLLSDSTVFFITSSMEGIAWLITLIVIWYVSAHISKHLLRWFINIKPDVQTQYSLAGTVIGFALICSILFITEFFTLGWH